MAFLSPATRRALDELIRLDSQLDPGSNARVGAPGSPALDRIRAIKLAHSALDSESAVLVSVREALGHGRAWDQIADASGLGTAAAKWRWQGTDEDIAHRIEAGRKRSVRPSSVPKSLPGLSVSEAAHSLGVTVQAIYLRIRRGTLDSTTVVLDDGRSYKRVILP